MTYVNKMDDLIQKESHRRYNPLLDEWILVSPLRLKRPWHGKIEESGEDSRPPYDPRCYLCPGNLRANGERNPVYEDIFVFENDFSALRLDSTEFQLDKGMLLKAESEAGICRVMCFTPRHDISLAEMSKSDISKVIAAWRDEYINLGRMPQINYVQIFENKGELMGNSNPHPHCQIWAQSTIPVIPSIETNRFKWYRENNKGCMLCDYVRLELEEKERIVFENDEFVAVIPFWAVWPFEVLLTSKSHITNLEEMDESKRFLFADAIKLLTVKYDNLFNVSFPYSAGIHQSPTDGVNHDEWHIHMHFFPPLLRSAKIRKFMVGYEMLGMPQRDITPEIAAETLKSTFDIHYKCQK
ncbi:MAG: UDP-glucose--hexose-1-phosphate uridylyltransferase [Candidatus Kryptoniota bacterium]